MRESNVSFPAQNRACVCISSALYDRRAIDAPAPSLPLVNSLTHLSYLTATSPRIREILTVDGGLERLVRILKACVSGGPLALDEPLSTLKGKGPETGKIARRSPFKAFSEYRPTIDVDLARLDDAMDIDFQEGPFGRDSSSPTSSQPTMRSRQLLFTYTLAFQCVVNIGVRGSETIRTRVVEAGALDVVITVLERFLEDMQKRKREAEAQDNANKGPQQITKTTAASTRARLRLTESSGVPSASSSAASLAETSSMASVVVPPVRVSTPDTVMSMDEGDTGSSSGHDDEVVAIQRDNTPRCHIHNCLKPGHECTDDDTARQEPGPRQSFAGLDSSQPRPAPRSPVAHKADKPLQFRDEDVLLSLQLLAYLSKYPHVRSIFHRPSLASLADASTPSVSSTNVFSLVEQFTHRPSTLDAYTPRHSNEVQYWAGVIMRNACRKDESRGGIRQCANMECGQWERYAREFAKCRRCRKAKYCSKTCQSTAWGKGHRYWCAKAATKESATTSASTSVAATSTQSDAAQDGSDRVGTDGGSDSGADAAVARDRTHPDTLSRSGSHGHTRRIREQRTGHVSGRSSRSSGRGDEEDDDDDELGPPVAPSANAVFARASPTGDRRPSLGAAPPPPTIVGNTDGGPRIGGIDAFGDVTGVGVGMALGMDEAQAAHDMMNGNQVVFDSNDVVL
ncbi:hypothetical protein OIO90_003708 [Microbotryomycetes sp. JL221]|nr:hypothetical protein OIO90_003708 [Microbotryomycetes sp. JL221]